MAYPPQAIGLFCEDIRAEKSGQETVVGIFLDELNVVLAEDLPDGGTPLMPKFGLYVRILLDVEAPPPRVGVRLVGPDGKLLSQLEVDEEVILNGQRKAQDREAPIAGIVVRLLAHGTSITSNGRFTAYASFDDEERIVASLLLRGAEAASRP